MSVTLRLAAPDLSAQDLQVLTRDMCDTLNGSTDVQASIPTGAAQEGAKGEPITLGTIALAFVTSGAAVSLFSVFRAYFERKKSLMIEIVLENGDKLKLKADDVTDGVKFRQALGLAKEVLDR